ncbi:hypothetical protein A4308_12300 [Enterobacter sp. ODB01]|nr:hypothetical protein A4308_12300 [Enterobacter sp. ODB01]
MALLFDKKIRLTEISKLAGVSTSTISHEVRRNSLDSEYSAAVAQRLSKARRRSGSSLARHKDTVISDCPKQVINGIRGEMISKLLAQVCECCGANDGTLMSSYQQTN